MRPGRSNQPQRRLFAAGCGVLEKRAPPEGERKTMLALYLSMLEDENEKEEFAALYERCKARALRAALGIVKDRALAEDAVHMGFLYLLEHYQRLKREYPQGIDGYFFQCVESRALNILRDRAREAGDDAVLAAAPENIQTGPESAAERADRLERAIAAIERLPRIYAHTLELHCTGWTMEEIAEVTGVSVPTARKRLERARQMVRREVDGADE